MIAGKKRLDVDKAVQECRTIANHYLKNWKPSNPEWKNIEGCAYLRLSTDDQVLVERGLTFPPKTKPVSIGETLCHIY